MDGIKLVSIATKEDLDKKQDALTPLNAGNNVTITGSGRSLKISAAGGVDKEYVDREILPFKRGTFAYIYDKLSYIPGATQTNFAIITADRQWLIDSTWRRGYSGQRGRMGRVFEFRRRG